MYRHQSVWVSTIREQYNRSFDHDMYLGLHPYIVLYRYIWVFDGIWEFGHSNRLTFRLHHTPLNTQIIHQPIVSETESLLKEIITIKEFQPPTTHVFSFAVKSSSCIETDFHPTFTSLRVMGVAYIPAWPWRYCGALCSALKKRTVILTCLQGIFGCVTWA